MAEQQADSRGRHAVDEPPKKASRAGRNLPAAIGVGVVLGAMAIGALLFAPIGWLPDAGGRHPDRHPRGRPPAARGRLRAAGHSAAARRSGHDLADVAYGPAGTLGAYGGTIVVCMVWRLVGQGLREAPVNYLRDISATVLLATWVPLFASFSALLIFQDNGGTRTFTVIVTVVFADIGGYVAGVLFGKHLMVPAISPKKSWEGLGGSLLFGVTAAVLSVAFLLDKPAWVGVPLGLMLVITGVLGDLVESQVKRDLGIKDMGTLLPGHGGIMDRIDAMLPSAVAGWIVLTLLA